MKTYNQFLNTPFSEEIKPPESQEEDPGIKSKEKRQQQIKKMVLLKKLQAVRAGAGADIVAGYEPEGEMVDETYFDSNTRGVSTKGGLVRQYNKPGKLSQSSLSNERKSKDPKQRMSKKEMRKSMEDDANYEKKMGRSKPTPSNLKTALKKQSANEEVELDERLGGKGYKPYTSLTGKKVSGDWEDSDRGAGNKAKKRAGGKVEKKSPTYRAHVLNKEEVVDEAKVDKGRSDYGKATIRNYRRFGPGHGEPAMFDPENKRGKAIEKRREEGKERRGKKKAKVPAYKVSEGTDKAFEYVKKQIAAKYGKSGYVSKDNPRKPQTAAEKEKVRAHQAKVDKENAAARAKDPSQGRYPKG